MPQHNPQDPRLRMLNGRPTPGSDAAIERGCTCPVLDNCHGYGVGGHGSNLFWCNAACPFHGPRSTTEVV